MDIFQLLWCQVFHLQLKLDVLRFTHTWGHIHNKCNEVVLSGHSRPFFKLEHSLMVKTRPTTWQVLRLASHSSIIVIISSSSYHRHFDTAGDLERRLSNQIPIDLFGLMQGSLCDLGVVLVLALWGATVVMAPRPHVAGGGSSRCSSPKPLWRNALTKLSSPPLSPPSILAQIITTIMPGLLFSMGYLKYDTAYLITRWILSTIIAIWYFDICL